MARTLQSLLDERAATLVGRDRERAALLELVERDRPLFAYVHGIGGVGKSTLLRSFAHDARAAGARVVLLDCGTIEPTEAGFRAAAGSLLTGPGPGRTVLLLDGYERFRLLDAWLRQRLLPSLPAEVRVVVAGREPPAAWKRDFGELVRTVALKRLAPEAALEVLAAAGVRPAEAVRINRIARGHPLALQLAAAALADGPQPSLDLAAVPSLLEEIAAPYLAGLEGPTREALDAASVVRRTTRSLLGAMLPGIPPGEAFDRLAALPFVELGGEGLTVHDTLREVIRARLVAADPAAHRAYRVAAWTQLRRELSDAPSAHLWRYTADLLYLVEHPVIHEAFFPAEGELPAVEPAREEDDPAIEGIVRRHAPPAELERFRAWRRLAPECLRVARDGEGMVQGASVLAVAGDVPARLFASDPLTAAWREHQRRNRLPSGSQVLYNRFTLSRTAGEAGSPAGAALMLDTKRTYLELRPALRRLYCAAYDGATVLPLVSPLGFERAADPLVVDGTPYELLMLDFGPASVDGWLSDVIGRELRAPDDPAPLDPARRQLVVDGRRIDLTKLEWDVLRYLHERTGEAVAREALLRDVWGYEWTGGSNVVEVAVSGLRRKLGRRAEALETVRGVGYRLVL